MCGRATDEDAHAQRFAAFEGVGMVNANVAADLVVEANFFVEFVVVARELDAVHTQVGVHDAGIIGVFGVDLGQEDKGATVVGPALNLGKLVDGGGVFEGWAGAHLSGQRVECDVGDAQGFPGGSEKGGWIGFGFYEALDPFEG